MPEPALRTAAVSALVALAASADPADRQDAGAALTGFLDAEIAQAVLHDLVLDPDPGVAAHVSAALARRADPAGWVVLVLALATSDEGRLAVVGEGVGRGLGQGVDADTIRLQAARTALRFQEHPEPAIRHGATRLLTALGAPSA